MPTNEPLVGQVAIVTGAGRGLGRAGALALAEAGADVALAARSADQLEAVAAEVRALGRRALVLPTDITDRAAVDRMVERTVEELGQLDILVNNSGILRAAPLLETTDEDWDAVVDTNLRGLFLATRAAGRHLVAQGSGKVVNVASNFAFRGVPGHASYCASKAAVVSFTRSIALEWARHGVQVNALAPGYFATDLNAEIRENDDLTGRILRSIPQRRMGRPEELGPWIVQLASPISDFLTGETIVLDGGQNAR